MAGELAALMMIVSSTALPQVVARPYGTSGSRQPARAAQSAKDAGKLLATFTGTVASVTKKALFVKTGDGNTLQFLLSGKTDYHDGSRKVKAQSLKAGQMVSVQAKVNIDASLSAVTVTVQHPKK